MRNWLILFCIFFTTPVFAQCNISQQQFGVSLNTMENKLKSFKTFDRIPDVQQQITTVFDEICPNEGEALSLDTNLYYHFIKDQLVSIQLERASYDDLLLFNWAREYFGIAEDLNMSEVQQLIQVEKEDRVIQLFVGILPDAVYQNVLLISRRHDDLFEWLAQKEDGIDWSNYEYEEEEEEEN